MIAELRLLAGDAAVLDPVPAHYLGDETEGRGLHGHADAVVLPADADEVAAVVRWCYEHDVAIVPRGPGNTASPWPKNLLSPVLRAGRLEGRSV